MNGLGAAICLALLVLVLWPAPPGAAARRRLAHLPRPGPSPHLPGLGPSGSRFPDAGHGPRELERLRALQGGASVLAGLVTALVVGGLPGAALGAGAAVGLHCYLGSLETAAAAARHAELAADLPVTADLLAACLAAGAPLPQAVAAVADALGGATAQVLHPVVAALQLGEDPAACWAAVERERPMAPLARALSRAAASGAPVGDVVARLAAEQRVARRWTAEAAARRVGVRAVAPLGACFLPAFLLLGVVPVVVGAAELVLPSLQ